MPEETNNATQADADVQAQAATTTTDESQAESSPEPLSLDEAKKLRSESAALRKRLKDAEARVQTFEQANQTESEKTAAQLATLQERADKAETELRKAYGKTAVFNAAGGMNPAVSLETIYRAVRDDLEFGDDGQPTNVDAALKAAQKADPNLFRTGTADGSKGGSSPNDANNMNRKIADRLGR